MDIYEWFGANLHRVREPSMRHYVRASVFVGPMPTETGMPVHCRTVRRMSAAMAGSVTSGHAGQIQERLVDRVDFGFGGELLERLHHAAAHVAVERVVAGEDGDAVPLDQRADLEGRIAHVEAEGLGLVAAGDDAAVVRARKKLIVTLGSFGV